MKSSSRGRVRFSSSATTTDYYMYSQQNSPNPQPKPAIRKIPITTPMPRPETSATKIQSAYRSYKVRTLVKKISSVNLDVSFWQNLIQRQETVDAIRRDEKERMKINEALMKLLLKLDSVPGIDPGVRDLRRHVSRRIVGLQEILDAVSDPRIGSNSDGVFLRGWEYEKQVYQETGWGEDLETICAGLRSIQRFLGDQ